MGDVQEAITRAHREEWARVVASLARRFGDLDIAEEAAAEAFATAVARWPTEGVPPSPGAWLTTTAQRKAIDRIRRESRRDHKQREAQLLYDDSPPEPLGALDDDRLPDVDAAYRNGRTSIFRLQALDPSVASLSTTSRSGASMIQKPARYSFDSR